jgi:hypothetical protein
MDSPNDVAGTNILPGIVENIKNDYDNVVTNRGAKIKGEDIKFPDNLGSTEFIRFEIYKQHKFDRTEDDQSDSLRVIYLPIPNSLGTNYGVSYSQDLGTIGYGAAKGVDYMSDVSASEAVYSIGGGVLNLLAQGITSGGALTGTIASGLASLTGKGSALSFLGGGAVGEAGKGAMLSAGIARNPHMAQIFENVNFRSHTFSYKLTPKNKKESLILKDIIKYFKVAMHPNYFLGNHFFDYPLQFDIDIMHDSRGGNPFMFNIGPSVLTSMSANYTPDGPYFHDFNELKAPLSVEISLSFTELKIVTQQEILDYNY